MSQLLAWGGQSIGVSASTSDLAMNIQDWFPLGLTGWISLQSKGLSRLLQHHSSKASILRHPAFFTVYRLYTSSHLATSHLCRLHASCSRQLFATVMETVLQQPQHNYKHITLKASSHSNWQVLIQSCQGGRLVEGRVRELGMDMYRLLYLKQVTSMDLLYSTWNSARCYTAAWMRG